MSPPLDSPKASTAASQVSDLEARGPRSIRPLEPELDQSVTVSQSQIVDAPKGESVPSGIGLWWPILGRGVAIGVGALVLAAIGNFSSSPSASRLLQRASLGASLAPTLGVPATTEWLAPAPPPPQPNPEAPLVPSNPLMTGSSRPERATASAPAQSSEDHSTLASDEGAAGTIEIGVIRVNGLPQAAPSSESGASRPVSTEESSAPSNREQTTGLTADGRVILNKANVQELTLLPGIGQKRAAKIVELRERLGGFKRISDLLRVRGIGNKSLRKLMPHLILNPPP